MKQGDFYNYIPNERPHAPVVRITFDVRLDNFRFSDAWARSKRKTLKQFDSRICATFSGIGEVSNFKAKDTRDIKDCEK